MSRHRREIAVALSLALLLVLVAAVAPEFYDPGSLRNLLVDSAPILVTAVGMTLILLAGEIDISVGSQFAVCGVVAGLAAKAGLTMPLVALATTLLGFSIGALHGLLVAVAGIPSMIVTLGTMAFLREGLRLWTGGQWVRDLPQGFQWFGIGQRGGEILILSAAAVLFLFFLFVLRWTSAGRSVLATGCDAEAARLIGIHPRVVAFSTLALMGGLAAAAALLNFTRYPSIESDAGIGMELKVIACVVVGGTSVQGGRGTLVGTLLGVLLLSAAGTILVFLRADPAWERALQGAILLLAVIGDSAPARPRASS